MKRHLACNGALDRQYCQKAVSSLIDIISDQSHASRLFLGGRDDFVSPHYRPRHPAFHWTCSWTQKLHARIYTISHCSRWQDVKEMTTKWCNFTSYEGRIAISSISFKGSWLSENGSSSLNMRTNSALNNLWMCSSRTTRLWSSTCDTVD